MDLRSEKQTFSEKFNEEDFYGTFFTNSNFSKFRNFVIFKNDEPYQWRFEDYIFSKFKPETLRKRIVDDEEGNLFALEKGRASYGGNQFEFVLMKPLGDVISEKCVRNTYENGQSKKYTIKLKDIEGKSILLLDCSKNIFTSYFLLAIFVLTLISLLIDISICWSLNQNPDKFKAQWKRMSFSMISVLMSLIILNLLYIEYFNELYGISFEFFRIIRLLFILPMLILSVNYFMKTTKFFTSEKFWARTINFIIVIFLVQLYYVFSVNAVNTAISFLGFEGIFHFNDVFKILGFACLFSMCIVLYFNLSLLTVRVVNSYWQERKNIALLSILLISSLIFLLLTDNFSLLGVLWIMINVALIYYTYTGEFKLNFNNLNNSVFKSASVFIIFNALSVSILLTVIKGAENESFIGIFQREELWMFNTRYFLKAFSLTLISQCMIFYVLSGLIILRYLVIKKSIPFLFKLQFFSYTSFFVSLIVIFFFIFLIQCDIDKQNFRNNSLAEIEGLRIEMSEMKYKVRKSFFELKEQTLLQTHGWNSHFFLSSTDRFSILNMPFEVFSKMENESTYWRTDGIDVYHRFFGYGDERIYLRLTMNIFNASLLSTLQIFFICSAFAFIAFFVISTLISGWMLKPFKMFTDKIKANGFENDYQMETSVYKDDFFEKDYQSMIQKIHKEKEHYAHIQQLKAINHLSQQVGHELRTSLTPLKLKFDLIRRKMRYDQIENHQIQEELELLNMHFDELTSLVESFQQYAIDAQPCLRRIEIVTFCDLLDEKLYIRNINAIREGSLDDQYIIVDTMLLVNSIVTFIDYMQLSTIDKSISYRFEMLGDSLIFQLEFENSLNFDEQMLESLFDFQFDEKNTHSFIKIGIAKKILASMNINLTCVEKHGNIFLSLDMSETVPVDFQDEKLEI
ncbi:hypothetical protein [Aureibacter tunicatorum]|uniref:Signal transduction histidine kinase n=1 Tax=Aureibacter tunicatorum TaxID=866807 RepID=A0AAE4BSN0_9BACT|nr:hypothetical protein [Aureibacter tunicatorum]MDR6238993.1 signal transduction histidine kinase [Aureibacter tunicatorum]